MNLFSLVTFSLVFFIGGEWAYACSSLYYNEGGTTLFGKNYVWSQDHGRIFVNQAGLLKKGLVSPRPGVHPHEWKAVYPSLTFNQIGEHFPNGGMNSKGLAVEILLSSAVYPKESDKPALNELQWIQFILDTAANTQEAITTARTVDILPMGSYSVHYHVCDRLGDCAIFEYHKGSLVVHNDPEASAWPSVATNTSLGEHALTKPDFSDPPISSASYAGVRKENDFRAKTLAFSKVLDRYAHDPAWRIIYDLKSGNIAFKMRGQKDFTYLSLRIFDSPSDLYCSWSNKMAYKSGGIVQLHSLLLVYNWRQEPGGSVLKRSQFDRYDYLDRQNFESLVVENREFLRRAGLSSESVEAVVSYGQDSVSCPRG